MLTLRISMVKHHYTLQLHWMTLLQSKCYYVYATLLTMLVLWKHCHLPIMFGNFAQCPFMDDSSDVYLCGMHLAKVLWVFQDT